MTTEEENTKIYEFQPYLVRVIDQKGVGVSFSHFSVRADKYQDVRIKRGVANIEVGGEKGDSVTLHVYTKDRESIVYAYKKEEEDWVVKSEGEVQDNDVGGAWVGYIVATIEAGDPPIAVG